MEPSEFDPEALDIVQRLQRQGYQAYFVGGCVRDLLMKRRPKDFDIATNARPQEIKRIVHHAYIIGRRFRLVLAKRGNKQFEIATFRKEPLQSNHYSAVNENVFGSPEDDAFRRDFTLNALFYDPFQRHLLDYVDGERDIRQKTLRVIGDPIVRFQEDPIRMLRAIRFCARLGFHLAKETLEGIRFCAHHLGLTVPDRTREELIRMLREGHAVEAYRLLCETGALEYFLPEWAHQSNQWLAPPGDNSPITPAKGSTVTDLISSFFGKSKRGGARSDKFLQIMLEKLDADHDRNFPHPTPFALGVFFLPVVRLSSRARTGEWDPPSLSQISDHSLLRELHNCLRLSNQENHDIGLILSARRRLFVPPKELEHKQKQSILRHPYFPHLLKLCRWEAEALNAADYISACRRWGEELKLVQDSGFHHQPWSTPGPYDRRDEQRATHTPAHENTNGNGTEATLNGAHGGPTRKRRRRRRGGRGRGPRREPHHSTHHHEPSAQRDSQASNKEETPS